MWFWVVGFEDYRALFPRYSTLPHYNLMVLLSLVCSKVRMLSILNAIAINFRWFFNISLSYFLILKLFLLWYIMMVLVQDCDCCWFLFLCFINTLTWKLFKSKCLYVRCHSKKVYQWQKAKNCYFIGCCSRWSEQKKKNKRMENCLFLLCRP